MCDFCKYIYGYEEDAYSDRSHILYDIDEDEFDIEVGGEDPFWCNFLNGVKFCPYCGRKLTVKGENNNA